MHVYGDKQNNLLHRKNKLITFKIKIIINFYMRTQKIYDVEEGSTAHSIWFVYSMAVKPKQIVRTHEDNRLRLKNNYQLPKNVYRINRNEKSYEWKREEKKNKDRRRMILSREGKRDVLRIGLLNQW